MTTRTAARGLAGCAIALILAFAGPASANVTYDWVPETQTVPAGQPAIAPFDIGQFVFTDAAIASGSVSFREQCSLCFLYPAIITGDPSGLVSIDDRIPGGGVRLPISNNGYYGLISFNIAFNADGTLGGSIREDSDLTDLSVSGHGNSWSGNWQSDLIDYCGNCGVTGYWQAIPEPSTFALLLSGIVAAFFLTYRRREILIGARYSI